MVAMKECEFYSNCLRHYVGKITPDTVVYIHLLPWFPVMNIFLFLGGKWVTVAGGRWDYCLDCDFALWWFLDGCDS